MKDKLPAIWQSCLEILHKKISKPSFDTWFRSLNPVSLYKNTVILSVPNDFNKQHLENTYLDLIVSTLKDVAGENLRVKLVVPQNGQDFISDSGLDEQREPENETQNEVPPLSLNTKYTFETFVVGENNRFAHAAALAVAEAPARAYNPLFLYGGVGLGKTHLMQAVGHYILLHRPELNVVYCSSESFTNEFINAIRDNRTVEFRNKYRNIDILLVDDIQFLAGKEQTQEEFFHTFNALHEATKQIVISSDRPPKDIPTLEDRLRSRFEWGLITDIGTPDLETRIAILRKKTKLENIEVPNDVIVQLANRIDTNIRELEGALIRITAYASLTNEPVTLELADKVLKDIIPRSSRAPISIAKIQQFVAQKYGLSVSDLTSKKRTRTIATPRQVAMYLCRELTDASLPKIGEEFGGRDHTTVLHAYTKINELIKIDREIAVTIDEMKGELKN